MAPKRGTRRKISKAMEDSFSNDNFWNNDDPWGAASPDGKRKSTVKGTEGLKERTISNLFASNTEVVPEDLEERSRASTASKSSIARRSREKNVSAPSKNSDPVFNKRPLSGILRESKISSRTKLKTSEGSVLDSFLSPQSSTSVVPTEKKPHRPIPMAKKSKQRRRMSRGGSNHSYNSTSPQSMSGPIPDELVDLMRSLADRSTLNSQTAQALKSSLHKLETVTEEGGQRQLSRSLHRSDHRKRPGRSKSRTRGSIANGRSTSRGREQNSARGRMRSKSRGRESRGRSKSRGRDEGGRNKSRGRDERGRSKSRGRDDRGRSKSRGREKQERSKSKGRDTQRELGSRRQSLSHTDDLSPAASTKSGMSRSSTSGGKSAVSLRSLGRKSQSVRSTRPGSRSQGNSSRTLGSESVSSKVGTNRPQKSKDGGSVEKINEDSSSGLSRSSKSSRASRVRRTSSSSLPKQSRRGSLTSRVPHDRKATRDQSDMEQAPTEPGRAATSSSSTGKGSDLTSKHEAPGMPRRRASIAPGSKSTEEVQSSNSSKSTDVAGSEAAKRHATFENSRGRKHSEIRSRKEHGERKAHKEKRSSKDRPNRGVDRRSSGENRRRVSTGSDKSTTSRGSDSRPIEDVIQELPPVKEEAPIEDVQYHETDIFTTYCWSLSRQDPRRIQKQRSLLRESIRNTPLYQPYDRIENQLRTRIAAV